ncbi:hypothetical protein [Pontibacter pamirensis]|uniref:hypothetical protein n=1 Tax=Pontibacter pamirensis TaxID=2562824 RepID=UPI00138993DD|nr:hypothetical protein [Pontibacter pamirensis]
MRETENVKDVWSSINMEEWRKTPCLKERIATEEDVEAGRAVFFIESEGTDIQHAPLDIGAPSLAYHIDQDTSEKTLVVVIQGEQVDEQEVAGVRYLDGGNGLCMLQELEFIME